MSQQQRNTANPPKNWEKMSVKQRSNWRKNTRRIERNEELRATYPAYHSSSSINIVHLHHRTDIQTINELIKEAEKIKLYALDTEGQLVDGQNQDALIQIQMVHSIRHSTMVLIETRFLPDEETPLYEKMEILWSTIFPNGNKILSWGPYEKELKYFQNKKLIKSGKLINEINLQLEFQEWKDGSAHPARESCDHLAGIELKINVSEDDDDDDIFGYVVPVGRKATQSACEWSLQAAAADVFNKFLDKEDTKNLWQCGIDLRLGTWKTKLFSKGRYDQEVEQEHRLKMRRYAIHDCTILPELYFHMYPNEAIPYQETTTSSPPRAATTTAEATEIEDNDIDPDVERQLLEFIRPKFNPRPATTSTNTTAETITTTDEERKKERQRRKNMKLKEKQKNNPNFQHQIRRPIYKKYDFQKVRAQLMEDNINPTHQIKINWKIKQVEINFRNEAERQQALRIVRINYFTREQLERRWG